jgi:hypothetical protein
MAITALQEGALSFSGKFPLPAEFKSSTSLHTEKALRIDDHWEL